jgi:hypothetical protein
MPNFYDHRLLNMLKYKRPHGSASEQEFVNRFLIEKYDVSVMGEADDPAAYVIFVGESDTLFSCHVDTVHRQGGKQKISYDSNRHVYSKRDGLPLGADDTAGCWIMLEMIDAKVPGTYMFHRGEEVGGIGSSYIADVYKHFLGKYERAIAFDRRGSTDVITHQMRGRCASDDFARALADAINQDGDSLYEPCDMGIFTDTANYTEIIPECTNISCGYMNEHTERETLHLPTLFALRDNCLRIDWEALPTVRDPKVVDMWDTYDFQQSRYSKYSKYSRVDTHSTYDSMNTDYFEEYGTGHPQDIVDSAVLYRMSRSEMRDMAYTDPETFVDLVRQELFGEYSNDNDDYEGLRYGQ